MSNPFYNASGVPAAQTRGVSATQRTEFTAIETGFGKLPSLNGLYGGSANYAADTGIVNALAVTLSPNLIGLFEGLEVVVKAAVTPTSAATLAVTGLTAFGAKTITRTDGSAMIGGEWVAGQFVGFRYRVATDAWQMDVMTSTSPTSGLPTTGGTMTGQLKFAKGTAVVAAGTVNLDAATGNDFHMTGNTTITAFTIAAGQLLKVIVDSAPLITYNATSLKVPGLANIQCAAGDTFWIMGDGSGNAIITDYTRADGSMLAIATAAEIKTGTSAVKGVTPAALLSAIGFTAYVQTADQTITSAGSLTIAHGLGRTPVLLAGFLRCITGELNYTAGDIVPVSFNLGTPATTSVGLTIVPDATNLNLRYANNAAVFNLIDKTTGNSNAITPANWKFFARAWA